MTDREDAGSMTRREYGGTLVIQVTNACPFRCPQCYAARGCTHIPVAYAEKQIDRLLRNRMGLVQLTGGEPLLYEGLFELIPFCARRGIYTAVATSGKGLREEHIPPYLTVLLTDTSHTQRLAFVVLMILCCGIHKEMPQL